MPFTIGKLVLGTRRVGPQGPPGEGGAGDQAALLGSIVVADGAVVTANGQVVWVDPDDSDDEEP